MFQPCGLIRCLELSLFICLFTFGKQHSTKINFDYSLFYRVFRSLPVYSQHLLVLLIGTFRVIHANSERAKTGMTAEALGVSVAPSFFHTCCLEGKIAKPEEVQKFKVNLITFIYIYPFLRRDHPYIFKYIIRIFDTPLPSLWDFLSTVVNMLA